MMLPKISDPLAKSVRTGEGIFVYACGVALVVASILPHGLSWTHSAPWLSALAVLQAISRSGVKIAAINAGLGIGAPIAPSGVVETTDAVLAEIDAVLGAASSAQAEPGVPAETVAVGLAPTAIVPPVTPPPVAP